MILRDDRPMSLVIIILRTPDISPGWTEHEYAEGSGHGAPSPMDLRGSDVEC
jgi:hypothetical protein